MDANQFLSLLGDHTQLKRHSYQDLEAMLLKYPYCQTLRFLLLKKVQSDGHRSSQNHLNLAATYSPDRAHLYTFLQGQLDINLEHSDIQESEDIHVSDQHQLEVEETKIQAPEPVINSEENKNISDSQKESEIDRPEPIEDIKHENETPEDSEISTEEINDSFSEILNPVSETPNDQNEEQFKEEILEEIPEEQLEEDQALVDELENEILELIDQAANDRIIPREEVLEPKDESEHKKPEEEEIPEEQIEDPEEDQALVDELENEMLGLIDQAEEDRIIPKEEALELEDHPIRIQKEENNPEEEKDTEPSPIREESLYTTSKFVAWLKQKDNTDREPEEQIQSPELMEANTLAEQSVEENTETLSETLAKILILQGNKEKAKVVYQKLSLKFPEKSSYFAVLIKELEN